MIQRKDRKDKEFSRAKRKEILLIVPEACKVKSKRQNPIALCGAVEKERGVFMELEEMDKQTRRELHKRLSRVGWALLAYEVAALGSVIAGLILFPTASDTPYLSTVINEVCSYIIGPIPMWLVLWKLPRGKCTKMELSPRAFGRTALTCVGTIYLFSLLTSLFTMLLEQLTGQGTGDLLQEVVNDMSMPAYALLAGVVAPIFEELIFRKLLLDRLRPFGDRCAIWVSAVAFGLFHMNLYQFFYATALGVIFAGVVIKTGKIWHSMLLHAITNLSSVVLSALFGLNSALDIALYVLVFGLCGLSVYWVLVYRRSYQHRPPQYPVTQRQALMGLLGAPGIWVCTVIMMAYSVIVIFFV
jgi:membrane protease YdiL (CAAX protease family)